MFIDHAVIFYYTTKDNRHCVDKDRTTYSKLSGIDCMKEKPAFVPGGDGPHAALRVGGLFYMETSRRAFNERLSLKTLLLLPEQI
ncbi:MAG: hypothetical protein WA821_15310 [Anaerolineales bacterium]